MQRVDECVLVGVVVPSACDRSPDPLPEDLESLRAHCCPVSPPPSGADTVASAAGPRRRTPLCFQTLAWKSPLQPSSPLLASQLGHCFQSSTAETPIPPRPARGFFFVASGCSGSGGGGGRYWPVTRSQIATPCSSVGLRVLSGQCSSLGCVWPRVVVF